jgi:hypothetical protein
VNSGNRYGTDAVGYFKNVVDYYRALGGRTPCGTSCPQQMVIACGATTVIYTSNTLSAGFDHLTVWAARDGESKLRSY